MLISNADERPVLATLSVCRERLQAKKEADAKREQEAAEEKKRLEEQAAATGDLSILGLLG